MDKYKHLELAIYGSWATHTIQEALTKAEDASENGLDISQDDDL